MRSRHDQHSHYVKVALALFWVLLVLPSTLMAGTVTIGSPSPASVTEGPAATVSFPLAISDTIVSGFTLSYTISGTNIDGSDYNDITGIITLTAGDNSGTVLSDIVLEIPQEGLVEAIETFTITLVDPGNGTDSVSGSQAVAITDNDVATLDFGVAQDQTVGEAAGTVNFVVTMSASSDAVVEVNYTTNGGTATADSDYTTASGTLTFAAGETTKTIPVSITDDAVVEFPTETFTVDLLPASLVTNGRSVSVGDGQAVGTITDNDGQASVSIDDVTVDESAGTASFTVSVSPQVDTDVTLTYALSDGTATLGSDYDYATGSPYSVTIPAESDSGSLAVTITDDALVDLATETFTVTLSAPSASGRDVAIGDAVGQGTITDNDGQASVSIDDVTVDESAGTASFTVSVSPQVDTDVTLTYALSDGTATLGSDYDYATGSPYSVTIPAESDSGSLAVTIADDDWVDMAVETYTVTLSAPSASGRDVAIGDAVGQGTINDNEGSTNVIIEDVTVYEDDSNGYVRFTLGLSKEVDTLLTVHLATQDGSATAGNDYVATTGDVVFAANTIGPEYFQVDLINNIEDSADRSFVLEATGVEAGGRNVDFSDNGICTIVDNDFSLTLEDTDDGSYIEVRRGDGSVINNGEGYNSGDSLTFDLTWTFAYQGFIATGTHGGITETIAAPDTPGASGSVSVANVTSDLTAKPLFKHNIVYTIGENGELDLPDGTTNVQTSGDIIVDHGTDAAFTNIEGLRTDLPIKQYCVSDVIVDGTSIGAYDIYTFSNVEQSHTLDVTFRENTVTATITPPEVGDLSVDEDLRGQWRVLDESGGTVDVAGWRNSGDTVRMACQVENYTVRYKDVPGWKTPPDELFTIDETTTGPLSFEGEYTQEYYELRVRESHLDGGDLTGSSITLDPVGIDGGVDGDYRVYIYQSGVDVELTANPPDGSLFHLWEGSVSSGNNYIIVNLGTDKVLTAVYKFPSPDNDRDGYNDGYDCNDNDAAIHPGAVEICGDGIDQDCDGADEPCGDEHEDNDGDGYSPSMGDCDDTNPDIHPGAYDDPTTDADEDCYDGPRQPQYQEYNCVEPAEVPLESQVDAASPMIMFLYDDSGSMNWEFMTDESGGTFNGNRAVFPSWQDGYSNDNIYNSSYDLQGDERQLWQSQWKGYNRLYFNPAVDYEPWPRWHTIAGQANANAHPTTPRLNPMRTATWNLDLTYFTVKKDTAPTVPAQYVQIRSQQNYRFTIADEVRLVPVSGGTTLRVDDNGSNSEHGYFDPLDFGTQTYTDYDAFNNSAHWVGGSGDSARWYFYPPQSGDYRVYAWVPNVNDLTYDVDYNIVHDGSSNWVYNRSQSANNGRYDEKDDDDYANDWLSLGTYTFAESEPDQFVIPMAHYFTHNDEDGDGGVDNGEIYLVALDGDFSIYRFTDGDNNNRVDNEELSLLSASDVTTAENSATASGASPNIWPRDADGNVLTYAATRQNFANWFSFYRRRELTAKAAIGRVVESLYQSRDRAQVGLAVLNDGDVDNHETMLVDANDAGDQSQTVLTNLYNINIETDGTPLRRALQDVGQYFDQHDLADGGDNEYLSTTPPWAPEAAGGGCQRAFAIVMTDGYYNGGDWTVEGELRDRNADSDGSARNPSNPASYNIPSLYDQGVFMGPNNANDDPTLADIAMFYYENDLDGGLSNNVQPYHYDIAPHQHMVTYSVAFGVHGDFDPQDPAYECLPQCDPDDEDCPEAVCPEWQEPLDDDKRKIDDLYHAAINGRGQFYTADDPQQLVDALDAVMKSITGSTATGSSVSINAQELQSDTALYQATYLPSDWSGDVMSKPLNQDTGLVEKDRLADGSYVDRVNWSAQDQLDSRTWTTREIITFNDTLEAGVTFEYGALSNSQKLLLDGNEATARKLVDFLRGDTSEEGGLFRDRTHILGDVVHASPIGYRWDSDPGVVFVGANDGMLHVLDEETGEEIFAYVPNLVFANLKHLADDPYVHRYYVDNEPTISKLGSSGAALLLGGLGRGGRGYYCLDISTIGNTGFDGEDDAGSIVKWEWPTNSDPENAAYDPDVGYTFGQGFVVNTPAGYVAIMPNGYDSENGRAVLFAWRLSSDGTPLTAEPRRIDTEAGANDDGADGTPYSSDDACNGLSSPALVDDNLDGLVDTAYAGDLLGNLWKFDLSSSNINDWDVAYKAEDGTKMPLFQAKNLSGFRQPITTTPDVMNHCDFNRRGNIVVFGTGRYLGMDDYLTYSSVETIYGIWDWADEWEALNPVIYSADALDPETKFFGYFDSNRQLSNLLSNPAIPGTDQIVYTLDLTASDLGDEVRINTTTFTHAPLTDQENHEFLAASGLAKCINDLTYGLSGVTAEASENKVSIRSYPADDLISFSITNVNGTITLDTEELKASLLQQAVIYSDDQYIVVSDNNIEWFDPSRFDGRHVGWYLDLPGSSERLVNDPMIRGGYVYAVPTIPSESPCKAGGDSIVYGLNACNGGQSNSALFNINGDDRVNSSDLINIGTPSNPIWVAPTGLKKSGLWYSPAVLGIEGTDTDRLYFSTSDANVETEQTAGEKLGFLYWRTW